jgi:hypothetical protein
LRLRQAAEARATSAASSRLRTLANLGVELVALAISRAARARTSHAARTSTSFCGLPQSNIISADGQARVFPHQHCDIKEQETGVELALKLPQIAPMTTTPGAGSGQGHLYSTALNRPRRAERHFALRYGRGTISIGRRYQRTNSSHPARGESFVSLLCSTLAAIPHHCFFFLSQTRAQTNRGSRHPFRRT